MSADKDTGLVELDRTPVGTYMFSHRGMAIHDPLSSDCGRFRWSPGDDSHSPSAYGFEVGNSDTHGTAWEREFAVDGAPVTMCVTAKSGGGHRVSGGDGIRVEVIDNDSCEVMALWLQDEGTFEDSPPTVLFQAPEKGAATREGTVPDGLECPNCGRPIKEAHHDSGCVLAAFVQVIRERATQSESRLVELAARCDASAFWDAAAKVVNDLEDGRFLSDN